MPLQQITFPLRGEFITLDRLLKACGLAESGGRAKTMVAEGMVQVDGRDERKLLRAIAKRPGALRSLSHILPLAHIYASGKSEPVNSGHIHSAMLELGHAEIVEE